MTEVNKLLDIVERVRFNPSAIQRTAINLLEEVSEGKLKVVDPTNPFVFLLESAAVFSSAAMLNDESTLRKQYAIMALTEEDLHLHMSDKDFINRFSSPATAPFTILLSKEEIYEKAVDTGVGGVRKLTIPRNSEFTVVGTKFTMQYPIDIRIMSHGGLQIVYDVTKPSPLQTLPSNVVDWDVVTLNQQEFIKLNVPIQQYEIQSYYAHMSVTNAFVKTYTLPNDFYYCRVYRSLSDGSWEEIKTTHTDQVFDPLTPTALLKVFNNTLEVKIPQIYQNTNLIFHELRIDIYTTKGPIDLFLNSYAPDSFQVRWIDIDGDEGGRYSSPLGAFTTMAFYSDHHVVGGSKSLTFNQLRERVLNNSFGDVNLPITNVQINNFLNDLGYEVVKNVDTVTNRIFLATKRLPTPNISNVSNGASCSINTISFKTDDVIKQTNTVRDNNERVTVLPNTLYKNINGVINVVSDIERNSLSTLTNELLVNEINNNRYLYSPFHYVFDFSNNGFDVRPYYLDRPSIETKVFIEENSTIGVELSTKEYSIEKTEEGYDVYIVTRSGVIVKELDDERVFAQLIYRPLNESSRAYLNGTLVGKSPDGERIYKFEIKTNYDVNKNDGLYLTNFTMFGQVIQPNATNLLGDFDLVLGVTNFNGEDIRSSNIDVIIDNDLIEGEGRGVSHERFKIRFGWRLNNLWNNSRTVAGNMEYELYKEDVYSYYEENVYERDPVTGTIKIELDVDNNVVYKILHSQGDPVLDVDGNHVIKHRKGDPVLDVDGNPIVISPRKLIRQVDIFLVEGNYYFTTENSSLTYKNDIPFTIVNWLINDLDRISENLLEQTQMFFYPQDTQSDVKVIVKEGFETVIRAEQSFKITFYLTKTGYSNSELRNVLTSQTTTVLSESLQKKVITINDITNKLSTIFGDDVIAVEVDGLGGKDNYKAITIIDDSTRLSLKKRSIVLPDDTIAVEDDVEFIFLQHEV